MEGKRSVNQKDCKCGCGKEKIFAQADGKSYCYKCYNLKVDEERAKDKPVLGR